MNDTLGEIQVLGGKTDSRKVSEGAIAVTQVRDGLETEVGGWRDGEGKMMDSESKDRESELRWVSTGCRTPETCE